MYLLSFGSFKTICEGGLLLHTFALTSVATATDSWRFSTPWPQLSGIIITSPNFILVHGCRCLFYVMSCYVISCYVMLHYVMSCLVILRYATLCFAISCHVMLHTWCRSCHVMSCHVMSCHVKLYFDVLCHVMLWCEITKVYFCGMIIF